MSLVRRIDQTGIPLLLARLAVGGMFAYLACMKLRDPIEFLKQTHAYGIFPTSPPELLNVAVVAMPWLEMVCAAALLLGLAVRGAAAVLLAMLLFFAPMLLWRAWSMYHGGGYTSFCDVKFDCGCGTGEVYICAKMLENTALKIGALVALLSGSRRFCLEALLCRGRAAARRSAG